MTEKQNCYYPERVKGGWAIMEYVDGHGAVVCVIPWIEDTVNGRAMAWNQAQRECLILNEGRRRKDVTHAYR